MEQVGRYRILGELGRGAMGVVYKAQDPAIGRIIAIKSIRLDELSDETERERLRERLFREAQSAGILSHPGIVTIYDIFEESGLAYIFMEFVNGPPLEKLMGAEQTPDKDTLLSILRQIASALDYAHRKGIIHRDIKPANIMIHEDGSAKVTDFGVAKIASQKMTQAGTILGTPTYMSPEQVQAIPVDGRADQFSLAVIAYEALTGERPFNAEHLPALLYKIVRDEPMPSSRLNPTLTARVDGVMSRALAKKPEDRFPSCSDFIEGLVEALNSSPGWTPFPRGASHHITTVGSQDKDTQAGAEDTDAFHVNETMAATVAAPQPPAFEWQVPAPHQPPPESHTLRNVLLLAGLIVLAAGGYFAYWRMQQGSVTAQPPPVVAVQDSSPVPTTTTIPPPPPVETSAPKQTPPPATATSPAPAPVSAVASPVVPAESDFQLSTTPPGATAEFDGNSDIKCRTPCTIALASGRHTFVVTLTGYREARGILTTPQDTTSTVNLERSMGTLNLVSNPPGLTVVLDGQEQSKKTPAIFQLAPGPHRVDLVRGSDRQGFQIEIHDGATLTRTVDWQ